MSKYFNDIPIADASWLAPAADSLYEKGILKGKGNGILNPNGTLTRAEMIALLDRTINYIKGVNTNTPDPKPNPETPIPEPENPTQKSWDEIEQLTTKASVLIELGLLHGTGTLLKGGFVLTAKHVASSNSPIKVTTKSDDKFQAYLVCDHPNKDVDLSIYKIADDKAVSSLPYLNLSNVGIKTGQKVLSIGFPKNEKWKVQYGLVCREKTQDQPWEFDYSIPVQSGNSGGGLINEFGEVVGVITQSASVILKTSTGSQSAQGGEAVCIGNPIVYNWLKQNTN